MRKLRSGEEIKKDLRVWDKQKVDWVRWLSLFLEIVVRFFFVFFTRHFVFWEIDVLKNWGKRGLSLVCLMCCVHFLHENMNYLLVDVIVLYCLVLKHAWLISLFLFCLIWCSVVVSSLYMSSSLCFYVTVFYCVLCLVCGIMYVWYGKEIADSVTYQQCYQSYNFWKFLLATWQDPWGEFKRS